MCDKSTAILIFAISNFAFKVVKMSLKDENEFMVPINQDNLLRILPRL